MTGLIARQLKLGNLSFNGLRPPPSVGQTSSAAIVATHQQLVRYPRLCRRRPQGRGAVAPTPG